MEDGVICDLTEAVEFAEKELAGADWGERVSVPTEVLHALLISSRATLAAQASSL